MAKVEDRDGDHWCTSEDVRDLIQIPDKGTERDFEQAIQRATNSVQSWYKAETGKSAVPDAGTLDDLLVEATAWLAASESTFAFARNFSGGNGDSDRTRTAEDKAHKKFNEWSDVNDVSDTDSTAESAATDTTNKSGSLIDEF